MKHIGGLVAACALFLGSAAHADLTITTSTRAADTYFYLTGNFPASAPPYNDSTAALGPWITDMTSSLSSSMNVRAFQNSDVSTTGMSGTCTVNLTTVHPPSLTDENSHGMSSVTVVFHVDTPTEVDFIGQLDDVGVSSNMGNFSPEVWLRVHNGAFLADAQYQGDPTHRSAQFQGVLQPGDYDIFCAAGYNRGAYRDPNFLHVTGTETAQFQFIIPAPAALSLLPFAAAQLARRRRVDRGRLR
jgi:hypothetical protein